MTNDEQAEENKEKLLTIVFHNPVDETEYTNFLGILDWYEIGLGGSLEETGFKIDGGITLKKDADLNLGEMTERILLAVRDAFEASNIKELHIRNFDYFDLDLNQ